MSTSGPGGAAARRMTATYRLQLHEDFAFDDAARIAPYLARLGVSHAYASPILRARPGSTHGYDVADPTQANPELGGEAARRRWIGALHGAGLGLLLDIVPNHMGTGPSNPTWEDLLAHGRASRWAHWYDVDWDPPDRWLRERVLLPVLGAELEEFLEQGELTPVLDAEARIRIGYHDNTFPIDPATLPRLIGRIHDANALPAGERRELAEIVEVLRSLPPRTMLDAEAIAMRGTVSDAAVARLARLLRASPVAREAVEGALGAFAGGDRGAERMRALLDGQAYVLAFWRRAAKEINYRRFFDINELAALRAEDPRVFEETHALVLRWVAEGDLDGLRLDHIDGLLDPAGYLERLRAAVRDRRAADGDRYTILVEKILSPGEQLRGSWPVQGTTGYEFLNDLEGIFVDPAGHARIVELHRQLTRLPEFAEVAYKGKVGVLGASLSADVRRLTKLVVPVARAARGARAPKPPAIRRAIVELIAALSVYRSYIDPSTGAMVEADRNVIERAYAGAADRGRADRDALDVVRDVLLGRVGGDDPESRAAARAFVARFQQTSGPATAKGVEDTALYVHVPLASLNEVGSEPDRPLDRAMAVLHEANTERARHWPRNLLCTNTHDTKRSADVRARIDVLSEIPEEWERLVRGWRGAHAALRERVAGKSAPDAAAEYLLYQTLVGIWPLPAADGAVDSQADREAVRERVERYMLKATREAKVRTSWTDQNEPYERALAAFLGGLLRAAPETAFLAELRALVRRIARPGLWNALARTLVHLTAPGTPDLYQGDELWHFALVDPDNRRPVDYPERERLLAGIEALLHDLDGAARPGAMRALLERPEDGRLKLLLTATVLRLRRERPELFAEGGYVPLVVEGERAGHVFAFARVRGSDAALTVVPRLTVPLGGERGAPTGDVWGDTRVILPAELQGRSWRTLPGGDEVAGSAGDARPSLPVAEILQSLPVALLVQRR